MTINALSHTQQPQPSKRLVMRDPDGLITRVFEDRNGDGNYELYSFTRRENLRNIDTHIVTYYDNDGDGLCDEKDDLIISNITGKDGKKAEPRYERTVFDNASEKPKMEDIVNPKQQKVDTSWLF